MAHYHTGHILMIISASDLVAGMKTPLFYQEMYGQYDKLRLCKKFACMTKLNDELKGCSELG